MDEVPDSDSTPTVHCPADAGHISKDIYPLDGGTIQPLDGAFLSGRMALGSVDVSLRAALLRQMAPGKARDAGNGHSLAKSRNAAWRHLTRNPKGRACFCAMRRYSSLIWNDQTSLLVPCLA
ncbi:hypothetical protein [Pseudomonas sp. BAY1663]|uniref:hypothetical protein n=1 Tax=Pseudomonas sp. BAY1663 TaxID=1439940 RepID=UPI000FFB8B9E|nr:hypothetical protein [Pseudomonas sp. BAY1663]